VESSVIAMAASAGDWEAVSQTHPADGYGLFLVTFLRQRDPCSASARDSLMVLVFFLANTSISSYARFHEISDASKVFDEMLERSVLLWTDTMISIRSKYGKVVR
jgi:pentatricopeptide repeat protein